ncbi:hypothetical protein Agub_g1175, partial [Astrephomene gubernaculifera]
PPSSPLLTASDASCSSNVATAATADRSRSAGDVGSDHGGSVGVLEGPVSAAAAAVKWRALWLPDQRGGTATGAAASGAQSPPALDRLPAGRRSPDVAAELTAAVAGAVGKDGDESLESSLSPEAGLAAAGPASIESPGSNQDVSYNVRQQQEQQTPQTTEAVLVVTHGEAVSCAASMVAPWVMVYEVRHTGYVVLASGEGVEEGNPGPTAQGLVGNERVSAGWELLPDPEGERGVSWMCELED